MKPPASPETASAPDPSPIDDIPSATERLFVEIADAFDDVGFQQSIRASNADMYTTRRYESAVIPDLASEYAALSECWEARDIPRLKRLLAGYFERRKRLGPEIQKLIDRPN